MKTKEKITVQALVNAPVEKVWNTWVTPEHIMQWNNASDDWHTPYAENDVRPGGTFKATMAARDGSASFDFIGTYTTVKQHALIEYTIEDGRTVKIAFEPAGAQTRVTETFETEQENSLELQQGGWQAILDNFKAYAEKLK